MKNFIKKHKKEHRKEVRGYFTAEPNKEMNTVDIFIGHGENRNHLYVFSVVEAKALIKELKDSIACLDS